MTYRTQLCIIWLCDDWDFRFASQIIKLNKPEIAAEDLIILNNIGVG